MQEIHQRSSQPREYRELVFLTSKIYLVTLQPPFQIPGRVRVPLLKQAQKLGINNNSAIVVYDDHGIYSSARAWWMFKAMGHDQIAVLNGGLKAWQDAGYRLEAKFKNNFKKGNFEGVYNNDFFKDSHDVLQLLDHESELIVDARAADRFQGLVKEPREGLRSGHIPGSINLTLYRSVTRW